MLTPDTFFPLKTLFFTFWCTSNFLNYNLLMYTAAPMHSSFPADAFTYMYTFFLEHTEEDGLAQA